LLLFTTQTRGVKDDHYAGDFAFDDLSQQVAQAGLAVFGIFFAVVHQHYQGAVCFFLQIAADGNFFKGGQQFEADAAGGQNLLYLLFGCILLSGGRGY
jgi:hypothetical protein